MTATLRAPLLAAQRAVQLTTERRGGALLAPSVNQQGRMLLHAQRFGFASSPTARNSATRLLGASCYTPTALTLCKTSACPLRSSNGHSERRMVSKCSGGNRMHTDVLSVQFWNSKDVWTRAAKNTLRCLAGCSIGDLGTLMLLQSYAPHLGLHIVMASSCAAGITTSLILETIVLQTTEGFGMRAAFKTALSMSMGSMLAMELAENAVELYLTGGNTAWSLQFAACIPAVLLAGFLTPLPYNYYMIRRHGRACH